MKLHEYLENMSSRMIASVSASGPSYQYRFPQPTMVSVKSMTKKSFKNARKKKKKR